MTSVSAWRHSVFSAESPGRSLKSPGVKQRAAPRLQKKLGRAKDVARRDRRVIREPANLRLLAELQHMLLPRAGQPRLA